MAMSSQLTENDDIYFPTIVDEENNGFLSIGTTESVEDTNASLAMIIERLNADEFPPVLPDVQQSMSAVDASDLLAWVQKDEYMKIQSYIAKKYKEHRKVAGLDPGITEMAFRAAWCQLSYYKHLKKYKAKVETRNTTADAIVVMLGEAKLSQEENRKLNHLTRALAFEGEVQDVGSYIDSEWTKIGR